MIGFWRSTPKDLAVGEAQSFSSLKSVAPEPSIRSRKGLRLEAFGQNALVKRIVGLPSDSRGFGREPFECLNWPDWPRTPFTSLKVAGYILFLCPQG